MTKEQSAIIQSMKILINDAIKKMKFNRYIDGVIKGINDDDTYNVSINNVEYKNIPSKNNFVYSVNDVVQILIKNGDFSRKFIDGYAKKNSKGLKLKLKNLILVQDDNREISFDGTELADKYSQRPESANLESTGSGGLSTFKVTKEVGRGKPKYDSHIIHMSWDTPDGYDAQIAVANNSDNNLMQFRAQKSGDWGDWQSVITTNILKNIFQSTSLTTKVTKGNNYSKVSGSCILTGNVMRVYCSATRSSAPSVGNITNEVVASFEVTHNGKISSAISMSGGIYGSGGVNSFYVNNISVNNNTITFDVSLSATTLGATDFDTCILVPVSINFEAYI